MCQPLRPNHPCDTVLHYPLYGPCAKLSAPIIPMAHTRVPKSPLHWQDRDPRRCGKRETYQTLQSPPNDSAPNAESHFNVLLFVRGKVKSSYEAVSTDRNFGRGRRKPKCPQITTLKRAERAKAESNQGPSVCQPNTLSLGQTSLLYIGALVVRWSPLYIYNILSLSEIYFKNQIVKIRLLYAFINHASNHHPTEEKMTFHTAY